QTSSYTTSANGTSISTPIVSGLAALLKSTNPSANPSDIINFITSRADKVAGMNGQNRTDQYGFGRINAIASIRSYQSAYATQSAYPVILKGKSAESFLSYKNSGNTPWYDDVGLASAPEGTKPVHLATTRAINRRSPLGAGWGQDQNRPALNFAAVFEQDGTTLAANQHAAFPGQIVKFSFTFNAPLDLVSGTYREYFQPIVEGGMAMNDPGTFLDATVTAPTFSSRYRAQSPYPSLVAHNQPQSAWLEYTNTGNVPWYDDLGLSGAPAGAKPVHLATSRAVNRRGALGSPWGGDQNRPALTFAVVYRTDGTVYATNPHVVQPGESARFEFSVSAPFGLNAGTYREYFQPIVEGGSIMNDPGTFLDMRVDPARYTSSYEGQCGYPTLTAGGASVGCFLKYKNTGNVPWYDDANLASAPAGTKPVHLATSRLVNRRSIFGAGWGADQNRPAVNFFKVYQADGTTEVVGATKVEPGQVAELRFSFQAPAGSAAGSYREYFQPIVEGGNTMNDPGTFLDVRVQ
ncbi:MAG TPA: S8 family serine peptidase, partial [Candidatus Saccharimonadales bacterium]|nr:S8 family serine peptidase [Candidatus Saccharimonadales bacterium]